MFRYVLLFVLARGRPGFSTWCRVAMNKPDLKQIQIPNFERICLVGDRSHRDLEKIQDMGEYENVWQNARTYEQMYKLWEKSRKHFKIHEMKNIVVYTGTLKTAIINERICLVGDRSNRDLEIVFPSLWIPPLLGRREPGSVDIHPLQ